jgi:ATP-dependent Clp protease ATP-binding subunit ClpC
MDQFNFVLFLVMAIIIVIYLKFRMKRSRPGLDRGSSTAAGFADQGTAVLYQLAEDMRGFFESTAHPKDLLENATFQQGVALLAADSYTDDQLLEYYAGSNVLIGCMALEALHGRSVSEAMIDRLVFHIDSRYIWTLYFVFRVLAAASREPVIGAVLLKTPEWWHEEKLLQQILKDFIDQRLEQGERPAFIESLKNIDRDQLDLVADLLKGLNHPGLKTLEKEIQDAMQTLVDREFLGSIGRVWEPSQPDLYLQVNPKMEAVLSRMEKSLIADPGRSVILTGVGGVGKSTHIRALAQRLAQKGYVFFEATAADIIAGQTYIGELEKRLRKIITSLDRRRRVIWVVPNFHELLFVGRHRYSPSGVLDMLMPFIDGADIMVIGETRPTSLELLTRDNPRIKTTFDIIEVDPMDDEAALALATDWAGGQALEDGQASLLTAATLLEAQQMVKQFLGDCAAPGNLLDFLKLTRQHVLIETQPQRSLTIDDLYRTLSQLTGLPRAILDERAGLDVAELRELFAQRVMGQPEAVDCLVERIAMIKAGLTDPTRPLGVFLFAGPTGTGKTEIAKTLAEFLFGSPERMIRLDMSEFKTAASEDRILGEAEKERASAALVNQIRKQPFSVVLLDEFEKAHANIWDLFLQVFDDGRLTDRQGNTANFRHAIIILTSNLGATIRPGDGIGFSPDTRSFSIHQVQKAIGTTFRREFINRLDRVVVFHPLSRTVMRNILFKELNHVFQRRGLRNREWAVEWEESALNFLLEKGFTRDLGARPLKRAIEQYLLAPLSMTIVNHQHPEGDQFLFVRSDNNCIEVEFIDPDTPAVSGPEQALEKSVEEDTLPTSGIKKLILAPEGAGSEVEQLEEIYHSLRQSVQSDRRQAMKSAALQQIADADFWQRSDHHCVLGKAEFMDRMEAALKTAGSLLGRLQGAGRKNQPTFSREIITRLAEQLYLLAEADKSLSQTLPKDAFLFLQSSSGTLRQGEADGQFLQTLQHMYCQWARKRRMRLDLLEDHGSPNAPQGSIILAVGGLGAYSILQPESGLHVLEVPKSGSAYERLTVRVNVAGQPEAPAGSREGQLQQARELFTANQGPKAVVVRRYRHEPSPLVRDAVRDYRTGLIEKVLSGDFDLFG